MLNSFRNFSGSITTKILMVILIASFAMWGIGDMLGRSGGSHTLAKIGPEEISVDSYRREFAIESDQVRRSLGANYSPELLKRLNVPQYVLQHMTQKSLLTQEAKRMGFIPDDTTVALEIRKNPAFLNNSGVFDKARFENALRSQSVSEKTYVENLRMQLATDKLLAALEIEPPITDAMLTNLQAAFNQGRSITLYKLSAASLPAGPAPKDADLEAFHHDHAELFTAPEFRSVSFVRFSASGKETAKALGEDEIKAFYNTHQEQLRVPEKREVEQLLDNSEEKAQAAYALVKSGKNFASVAKTNEPLNKASLSLGLVDKKSIPEAAADKVFALKNGETTAPVASPFGWHIFHVTKIEPEGVPPLEKIKSAIESELKQESHESELTDRMNQMEDALAGGSTLKEAATTLGLKVEDAGTFDKSGKTPQGTPDKSLPDLDKFVEVAFKTDEKTESSVVTSKNGVYYVLRVETVAPEKLRPLAEVKNDVLKAYGEYESEKKIADLASKIDEELSKKTPAREIISSNKLPVASTGIAHRDSKSLGDITLLPSFTQQIFAADIGSLTSPARDKNGDYLLAQINDVAAASASADDKDLKARKSEMTQSMQEEMMMQYLRYLETLYPVVLHQEIFDQLMQDNTSDASR